MRARAALLCGDEHDLHARPVLLEPVSEPVVKAAVGGMLLPLVWRRVRRDTPGAVQVVQVQLSLAHEDERM
jgi:hypothetical protein